MTLLYTPRREITASPLFPARPGSGGLDNGSTTATTSIRRSRLKTFAMKIISIVSLVSGMEIEAGTKPGTSLNSRFRVNGIALARHHDAIDAGEAAHDWTGASPLRPTPAGILF